MFYITFLSQKIFFSIQLWCLQQNRQALRSNAILSQALNGVRYLLYESINHGLFAKTEMGYILLFIIIDKLK